MKIHFNKWNFYLRKLKELNVNYHSLIPPIISLRVYWRSIYWHIIRPLEQYLHIYFSFIGNGLPYLLLKLFNQFTKVNSFSDFITIQHQSFSFLRCTLKNLHSITLKKSVILYYFLMTQCWTLQQHRKSKYKMNSLVDKCHLQ